MIDHGDEAAHEAAQGHVHIERHSGSKVGILNASGLNNVQAGRGAAASLAVGLTGFLTSTQAHGHEVDSDALFSYKPMGMAAQLTLSAPSTAPPVKAKVIIAVR